MKSRVARWKAAEKSVISFPAESRKALSPDCGVIIRNASSSVFSVVI
jgi:hypothetical protein